MCTVVSFILLICDRLKPDKITNPFQLIVSALDLKTNKQMV